MRGWEEKTRWQKEVDEVEKAYLPCSPSPHLGPRPPSALLWHFHSLSSSLSLHLSPTHLFLGVQVQEVGGIQATIHTLLVPGQPTAHRPALGGRPKHELPRFTHFHRWGWSPLLLLGGGQRVSQPQSPSSPALSRSPVLGHRQGRQVNSPLSVWGENREAN